ncbi:sulfatase [Maribacter algarum]|uniref:Sulfatase n=1 Tax=Maribacter algarum (ex Zhang et al. 2020) TaxID=2578118 RepID=A0A5S3PHF2_9FLAO|nr:sulfatase-like hydrolase/transferase [Maribacter algarum]TMM53710.1 sulfatase [Maribacter algarum]
MKIFKLLLLFFVFLFFSCSTDKELDEVIDAIEEDVVEETMEESTNENPNILLIIADDMGLDASPGYALGSIKPNMPNLQNMISSGLIFNNVWSYPTCTPTRASIITGKYGFRTNVMKVDDELSTTETSIQKYLDENTNEAYSHAVIGKWHLSRDVNHATNMGVGKYAGFLSGGVQDYSNWTLVEDGNSTNSTEYTTTKFTDLAIDWVDDQTKPWFLWLAYNAPHTPFHVPPSDLHSQGSLPTDDASISNNPTPYYMAALEAVDTEMGRLLASLSVEERENTIIIFVGDNGTPGQVVQEYNSQRAKGKVYQGGVNAPMIISGADVTRQNETEDALINTTDLFATIADLAGSGTTEIHDSRSFKGLLSTTNTSFREFVYTEVGNDLGTSDYTIRNATHKYIKFADGSEALYNLIENPLEQPNLLNTNQLPLSEENSAELDKLIEASEAIRN